MPALHKIDDKLRVIITTWHGAATDSELTAAFSKYQHEIKSRPEYSSYNEILDLTRAGDFKLSTAGLIMLGRMGVKTDVPGLKPKLAIVVSSPFVFGLARMYEAYRSLLPGASKDVGVFKNFTEALRWIETSAEPPSETLRTDFRHKDRAD